MKEDIDKTDTIFLKSGQLPVKLFKFISKEEGKGNQKYLTVWIEKKNNLKFDYNQCYFLMVKRL